MRTERDIPTGQPEYFFFKRFIDKLLHLHCLADQSTDQENGFFLAYIGKKAEVPDFLKSTRQNMEQEPADKLHSVKGHCLCCIVVGPVFVGEDHFVIIN